MKNLFLWLLLATASCVLTICIFSYTLPPQESDPNALYRHFHPHAHHRNVSGDTKAMDGVQIYTNGAQYAAEPNSMAMVKETVAATAARQTQTLAPATRRWFGYGIAVREMVMLVAVGNPIVLGGVVGLIVTFFKLMYEGRIGV